MLRRAVEESNITQVAAVLDLSRTTVSLVLANKYNASTDKIAERVIATYGRVACPHLGREITMPDCRTYREKPVPMSSADELRHWGACYSCTAPDALVASGVDN